MRVDRTVHLRGSPGDPGPSIARGRATTNGLGGNRHEHTPSAGRSRCEHRRTVNAREQEPPCAAAPPPTEPSPDAWPPSSAKGRYLKKVTISTTMGPGIQVDPNRTRNLTVDEPSA